MLCRFEIAKLWQHLDARFLLTVLSGIITSILLLSKVLQYLLDSFPYYLLSLFLGIVLMSAVYLYKKYSCNYLLNILGIVVAIAVTLLPETTIAINPMTIIISGAIAITAMLIPGISGSFLLLIMGVYSHYIEAVANLDLAFIGYFILGSAIGILSFSKLIKWLLNKYEGQTMSLLVGFIFGSLILIWPYKQQYGDNLSAYANILPWQGAFDYSQHTIIMLLFVVGVYIAKLLNKRPLHKNHLVKMR